MIKDSSDKQEGLLIAFDGIDSSGKETQARNLAERLRYQGFIVHRFETPDYNTKSGKELKERLQNKDGSWQSTPWQEKMKFFANNRTEHKEEVIKALQANEIVIYDRYIPSSLAFITIEALLQQTKNKINREQIQKEVIEYEYGKNQMPKEDVSIFLDVPPEVSTALLEKRKEKLQDKDEYTDHIDIQKHLYNEYDLLCTGEPEHYFRIKCVSDGKMLSAEYVSEIIWEGIVKRFSHLHKTHV